MVSKAKSIKGSSASIQYIQSDKELGDALELDRNGIISDDPNEIMDEFRFMQEANEKCQKNTISIVISPSDEKKFTPSELRDIGRKHLKGLGLDKNQYLMTLHQSTGKPHIHIIANRINEKGVAVKDNFISLKSQTISENMAKERGLLTSKDVKKINDITRQPIKNEIKQAHQFAISNSKTFDNYKDLMFSKGIIIKPTINKNNQLQGFRMVHKQSGLDFKASQIGKNFGVKNLVENQIKMPNLSPPLQQFAINVAKFLVRSISQGAGIGY